MAQKRGESPHWATEASIFFVDPCGQSRRRSAVELRLPGLFCVVQIAREHLAARYAEKAALLRRDALATALKMVNTRALDERTALGATRGRDNARGGMPARWD